MSARPPRRPDRYRVRVTAPDWTAELLIEHGFCTGADAPLIEYLGTPAPWLKGHFLHRGWVATMLPPGPAQDRLL